MAQGGRRPNARTRDLYDAFGVESDSDDDSEAGHGAIRGAAPRYRDDVGMNEFLADDNNSPAGSRQPSPGPGDDSQVLFNRDDERH